MISLNHRTSLVSLELAWLFAQVWKNSKSLLKLPYLLFWNYLWGSSFRLGFKNCNRKSKKSNKNSTPTFELIIPFLTSPNVLRFPCLQGNHWPFLSLRLGSGNQVWVSFLRWFCMYWFHNIELSSIKYLITADLKNIVLKYDIPSKTLVV